MHKIVSKLPNVGTTIFTVMSQMAAEFKAINLSQGFPDYDIDPLLLDKVHKYHNDGLHQYAPMPGIPKLRTRIQEIYQAEYQIQYDTETEILITNGASEAIFSTIASLVQPADEVIIFEPAYDLYAPTIQLFGGIPVPIATFAPHFSIDWDKVAKLVNDKTKLIIINNPNNPTGKMWSKEDFEGLETIVARHPQVLLLSDEVYAWITLSDKPFYTIAQFETLKSRSIITASFGKLLHATGWKIGYCVAPKEIMNEIKKVHQFNVFSVNHALQYAIADYLEDAQVYKNLPSFFSTKYNYVAHHLEDIGFDVLPSDGTYFLLAQYGKLSNKSDVDFSKYLIEKYGVATIPVSAFYQNHHDDKIIRFCFAKKQETLQEAIKRLYELKS